MSIQELIVRATSYGEANNIVVDFANLLGTGQEGYVWKTNRNTAVKVFDLKKNFDTELGCYEILEENDVRDILGFAIPQYVNCDHDLMIVEMSIVSSPYILDFGKAYLRKRPDFSPEVLHDYEKEREDWFEGNWDLVSSAIAVLERFEIYYMDARPGNINCDNHPHSVRKV